jgi:hypothetical protein
MQSKVENPRKKGGKPKGSPKTGGRQAGTPNKATGAARLAFAQFVDNNADKLQEWLDNIATDEKLGPKVAFDCLMQVAEFHVPKLARTEHVGENNGPIKYEIEFSK